MVTLKPYDHIPEMQRFLQMRMESNTDENQTKESLKWITFLITFEWPWQKLLKKTKKKQDSNGFPQDIHSHQIVM